MKITSKFITVKTYEITEDEAELIKHCLKYCGHRLAGHQNKGIHKVTNYQAVADLIDAFNK